MNKWYTHSFYFSILSTFLLLARSSWGQSAPQQLDPTFRLSIEQYAQIYGLQPLADSSCLILGAQVYTNGIATGNLVRVNTNGQVEQRAQQLAQIDIVGSYTNFIPRLLRYPDGRLLLMASGDIHIVGYPQISSHVVRLLSNGQPDPSFSLQLAGKYLPLLRTAALQADGKILLAGSVGIPGLPILVRLNVDGSYDESFAPVIGTSRDTDEVDALAVQPDGRILVGGLFSRPASSLLRLLPNGQLDPSFQAGITSSTSVQALLIRPTGQIVVGASSSLLMQGRKAGVQQLLPSGQLDNSFQTPAEYGILNQLNERRIELLPDGRLLVLSSQSTGLATPIQLLANGQLNSGYQTPARWSLNPKGIAVDAAGNLLVYGQYNHRTGLQGPLQRLQASGQLDEHYAPQLYQPGTIVKMARLTDGRTVLAGSFDKVGGVRAGNLACLLPNDEVDTAFVRRSPIPAGYVEGIVEQPSGKILIAGLLEVQARQRWGSLIRLHPSGALDTTFQRTAGYIAQGLALQRDGRIIVGGELARAYTGHVFARLSVDGVVDKTFQISSTLDNWLREGRRVVVQPDDKLILAGYQLHRVLPNGQYDTSFQATEYNEYSSPLVRDMVLRPDGKLLVCGQTPTLVPRQGGTIARFLPNGKLDMTLEDVLSYRFNIRTLLPRQGGGLWAGGIYHSDNVTDIGLMSLDERGQIDPAFTPVFGYGYVLASSETAGGKILVGGNFVYATTPTVHHLSIARIASMGTPLANSQRKVQSVEVYPNPSREKFTVSWDAAQAVNRVCLLTLLGQPLQQHVVEAGTYNLDLSVKQLSCGIYLLQIDNANGRTIRRVVVE
ncbi:T9SS type A sorting domain-containing protein [Hymenobacter sp. GOD-10R]|uniref:T9SS type A sorting domain-containing protein n=1 Tax=Hymenobacter sp. GOD-10R TaxID=3093922 RepID=UPI002D78A8C3|nr:T9SS type A sorting domain-containing protein [Hymenobacter sp. GOD-10R]WRQ28169.1 T9SS type A sorting domain-containing protein [Hymenobacter sp. GOD-10R]